MPDDFLVGPLQVADMAEAVAFKSLSIRPEADDNVCDLIPVHRHHTSRHNRGSNDAPADPRPPRSCGR